MDLKNSSNKSAGKSPKVLIPVDFSQKGNLALLVGFELGRRLNLEVMLLHASTMANPTLIPQFPDDFYGMDTESEEIEEMELEQEVNSIDEKSMESLKKRILQLQNWEKFPNIPFDTANVPGMPEEVISEYCQLNPTPVIVMATRGLVKRKEELVGSVTAEVIDHCVAPVFTVPEEYTFTGFKNIIRICCFCYFDESGHSAIARLMEMFGNPNIKIYLFPATDKVKGKKQTEALNSLRENLIKEYPNSEFIVPEYDPDGNLRDEFTEFFKKEEIQMILAPNKKKNLISRLFNPGLPHKILYEVDFPMLAIPV